MLIQNRKNLATFLIVSVFIVSGIEGIFDFDGIMRSVVNKKVFSFFPFPTLIGLVALGIKVFGSYYSFSKNKKYKNMAINSLILFIIISNVYFHNPLLYSKPRRRYHESYKALKNFGLIGGLILLKEN